MAGGGIQERLAHKANVGAVRQADGHVDPALGIPMAPVDHLLLEEARVGDEDRDAVAGDDLDAARPDVLDGPLQPADGDEVARLDGSLEADPEPAPPVV